VWLAAGALSAAPKERRSEDENAADSGGKRKSRAGRKERAASGPAGIEWLPSHGPECIKRGPNAGFCAGPRKVPKPHGEAAALAERLGLGSRNRCSLLLLKPPPQAWVEAARAGGHAAKTLLFPVEHYRMLRGIGNLRAAERRRRAQFSPDKPSNTKHHPHEGLDIGATEGEPIHAAQQGLVVYSDNVITGYGNLVIVVHGDATVALYAHCRATYVFPGQRVSRGQVIGEVGHTGFARGDHVHFEYRVNGLAHDPTPLFQ
jgi:murein DD-endopeptidase MepM/ murein hydrolase activator NlpD